MRMEGEATMDMVCNESTALARDRMLTYQLLSSLLFSEPTAEMLANLHSSPSPEGKLGDYLSELPEDDAGLEQARVDAAADFAALFLGMSAHPVAPYESVYTSPEQLLMQDARDEVLAAYRQNGFQQAEGLHLPEDHAATELEFMAKLCEREMMGLQEGDAMVVGEARAAQAAFLKDHLQAWLPRFCDDVQARASTGLYAGVAQLLAQVLAAEAEELGA